MVVDKDRKGPLCLMMVNMTQKVVLLKKGTNLGQLYDKCTVPIGIQVIKSVEEMMDIVTEFYINHHDEDNQIALPNLREIPIFQPSNQELTKLGITIPDLEVAQVFNVFHIGEREGEGSLDHQEIPTINWDFNPKLNLQQKQAIKNVLQKHQAVFRNITQGGKVA